MRQVMIFLKNESLENVHDLGLEDPLCDLLASVHHVEDDDGAAQCDVEVSTRQQTNQQNIYNLIL